VGPDEPRYVRVAVEMHRAGHAVVPTLQGQPWLEKPPLYYWLAGLGFSLLGETELAARLPSVFATVLLVGATALVGARLYGRTAGLYAGFVLGTSILPFAYGHAAAMDMLVAAAITLSVGFAGLAALGVAGSWALPAAWFWAGLGTLAKGPLGLLIPLLVVGSFLLVSRDWGLLRRALSPVGLVLFLLVAGPWYYLAWKSTGAAFVETFLLEHNVERFLSTVHHHPGNPAYYVPVVLGGLFPWTPLIVPGLAGLKGASRIDRFVLCWFLAPFLFFSAAGSKLPGYILPCLPPLALVMGRAAVPMVEGRLRPLASRLGALLGVALGALVGCVPVLLYRSGDPGWASTAPLAAWGILVGLLYSRRLAKDPGGALDVLRVGGAGLLLLLGLAAPEILARNQSGRALFLAARGQPVLALGAWRTSWMAGYFYNDGNVREARDLPEVTGAAEQGPVLVLAGPSERQILGRLPALRTLVLAHGPRGDTLLRLERR
jgi:4-amino-4-deoxy-L-arabinose transferase-like glycosyltransferase